MNTVEVTENKKLATYELKFILIKGSKSNWNSIQDAISLIKTLIPPSNRSYNAITKVWEITDIYWTRFVPALIAAKFKIEWKQPYIAPEDFFYTHTSASAPISKDTIAAKLSAVLGIVIDKQTQPELKTLYRRKALELHPDRNAGDGSKMSELNMLWTEYWR